MSAKNNINTASYNDHTRNVLSDLTQSQQLQDNRFIMMIQNGRDESYLIDMMSQASLQSLVRSRYELVQLGNKLMDTLTPRIQLKNPDTHEQGLSDLSFLVWYISKVAIISSPFLVNGRSRFAEMIGNAEIANINTTHTSPDITHIFDSKSFEINLQPAIMYLKKD
jgi:methionyl-tRNA synthetase